MRFFNTEGPIKPDRHYGLPPLWMEAIRSKSRAFLSVCFNNDLGYRAYAGRSHV